ncbi:ABC transporter ATP-binding protein [Porticoccus sp. W117]|uniref:ABC transporter ATP-binding protein n=1 Tax=Porticoccus sp. W117 TaxID=3054777 RepID=UPI002599298A|nr:ABC transporter ATP-binding protein [Porticoccus sp. W117]MDM3871334.1 ABC transporter ATP-binding protein [Porticoccus sp. W117]
MTQTHTSNIASNMIAIENMQFAWPRQKALLNIENFTVPAGEKLFLYGPSGSGKTTLLNLLAGVTLPQQGKIRILDQDLAQLSGHRRDRFRARHIGVIFQQFNLIPYLSVLDNVLLAAHFAQRKGLEQRARDLLAALNLPDSVFQRRATQLSVGQQQRVAVARALLCEPELVIADEPTSALDSDSRERFLQLLFTAVEQCNSSLIFVSHDRSLQQQFSRAVDIRELSAGAAHHAA